MSNTGGIGPPTIPFMVARLQFQTFCNKNEPQKIYYQDEGMVEPMFGNMTKVTMNEGMKAKFTS